MRKSRLLLFLFTALTVVLASGGLAHAAAASATASRVRAAPTPMPPGRFTTFGSFRAATQHATYADYSARSQTGGVKNAYAFGQMQLYIERLYRGVQTVSSFKYQGNTFDCVTEMSQPTVRALGLTHLATPPRLSAAPAVTAKPIAHLPVEHPVTSPLRQGLKDYLGHEVWCPSGTIPMERLTLEIVTRFPTLHGFLSKGPSSRAVTPDYDHPHLHAYGYQYVTNSGGNSTLNLWNPSGDFSLSQQWYIGGSGSSTQTIEGGWVRNPPKFGSNSVLFTFYTPNDYTSGCYDLDCTGFMQVNNSWALGAGWTTYSSYGGTQYDFTMQWKYYQGNWWLLLKSSGNYTAVGYYPGSLYGSGPLSTGQASLTEFGGETCGGPTGGSHCTNPSWPQMGSGMFASAGYQRAAYQNTVFYIDSSGATAWNSLTPVTESPSCYTINFTPASSGGSWGSYVFFGGPGGSGC